MAEYISGISLSLLVLSAYLAFGRKLYYIIGLEKKSVFINPASFALALCFTGTFIFVAGIFHLYFSALVYLLLFAMLMVSIYELKEIAFEIKEIIRSIKLQNKIKQISFWIFLLGFIYIGLAALTPPVYYDSLVYHLGCVSQYKAANSIIDLPGNIFSYFPQLISMNYLFCIMLSGELCVKLFQFFTAIMGVYAVVQLAGLYKGPRIITAIIIMTSPLFILSATRAATEAPLMFFVIVLLLFAVVRFERVLKTADNIFIGIMLGSLMSIKYTAGIVVIFFLIYMFYMFYKKRETFFGICIVSITAMMIMSPYLIRNYLYAGEPLYPFITGLFNIKTEMVKTAFEYTRHVLGFGPGPTLVEFLISPWLCASNPAIFGGDATAGMLLVSFILIIAGAARHIKTVVYFFIFYYITWYFSGAVLRFLLPAEAAGAIILSSVYGSTQGKIKNIALTALIVVQSAVSVYFVEKYLQPLSLFSKTRAEYIASKISYYKAAEFINKYDKNLRIAVLLGEARTFYFNIPIISYTVFNKKDIIDDKPESSFITKFSVLKAGYLIINRTELERLKNSGFADVNRFYYSLAFKNIMDKYFKKLYIDNDCEIYEYKG